MGSNLLIRLIDVVLIILFGFIGISDIKNKTQLKIPGEQNQPDPVNPITANVYVQVKINPATHPEGEFEIFIDSKKARDAANLESLRQALIQISESIGRQGKKMVVVIDPADDVTMQRTVDVFDLCEEQNFVKSIDFRLENEALQ